MPDPIEPPPTRPAVTLAPRRRARALLHEVDQRAWELRHQVDIDQFAHDVESTQRDIDQLLREIQQDHPAQAGSRPLKRLERKWARLYPLCRAKLGESKASQHEAERLGRLRTLRTDVQDLRSVITRVRSGKTSWRSYEDFVRDSLAHVDDLIDGLKKNFPDMEFDDELRHVCDLWQQIKALITEEPPAEPLEDQLARLDVIDTLCHDMISTIGWRTIPDRLNTWLDNALPGTPISFHKVFDDELPELADRQRLLSFLSFAPRKLKNAIVDAESGFVYKYHRQRWIRVTMVVLLVLLFLAATAGVVAAGMRLVDRVDRVPSLDWRQAALETFIWWVAVVAGVAFHSAAGSIKRARTLGTASSSGFTVGHVTQWIDARINALLLRIVAMAIGAIGAFAVLNDQLVATSAAGSAIFTMFLVGYGLDSFLELFFETAGDRAAKQSALVRKQLATAEPIPAP